MRCETTSSVKECALRARSSDVHVARVFVSLVVDAVVGLTLGLIAHVVVVVFVVAILHRIFLYGRYTLYIFRGSSVFEIMHAFFACSGTGSVPFASSYRLTSSRNSFRRSSTSSILAPNL